MKKFILSSVLMLGLTFAANANTAEMTAPAATVEAAYESDFCAWMMAALFECYGIDTSTPGGFGQYQQAVALCIIAQNQQ